LPLASTPAFILESCGTTDRPLWSPQLPLTRQQEGRKHPYFNCSDKGYVFPHYEIQVKEQADRPQAYMAKGPPRKSQGAKEACPFF